MNQTEANNTSLRLQACALRMIHASATYRLTGQLPAYAATTGQECSER